MEPRKILSIIFFFGIPLLFIAYLFYYYMPSPFSVGENLTYVIVAGGFVIVLVAISAYYTVRSEYFKKGLILEYIRDGFTKPVIKSRTDRMLLYFTLFVIFLIVVLYGLIINNPNFMYDNPVFGIFIIIIIFGAFVALYLQTKSRIALLESKNVKR